jgi:lipopolysaccharide export system protein LptA
MSIQISHLRRWFAGGAIGLLLVVAMVYFYARHKVENALKEVPAKIGIEIQQSAKGFTVSRSAQGHTIFKIEASKAVQYKQGGHAELQEGAGRGNPGRRQSGSLSRKNRGGRRAGVESG